MWKSLTGYDRLCNCQTVPCTLYIYLTCQKNSYMYVKILGVDILGVDILHGKLTFWELTFRELTFCELTFWEESVQTTINLSGFSTKQQYRLCYKITTQALLNNLINLRTLLCMKTSPFPAPPSPRRKGE